MDLKMNWSTIWINTVTTNGQPTNHEENNNHMGSLRLNNILGLSNLQNSMHK